MAAREIYRKQSFGQRVGFGGSPALLIVDLQNGFKSPDMLGGYNIATAIDNAARLLAVAREARVPIAHVCFEVQDGATNLGPFGIKVPGLAQLKTGSHIAKIVDELAPINGEYLATKQHASAFFGTSLTSWLVNRRVDTLLIAGCTTSGCVRATVVDASAYGLRPIVVEECVGDRAEEPHKANLFDIDQKYGDVVPLAAVLERLRHRIDPAALGPARL